MLSGLSADLHGVVDDSVPPPGGDVPLLAELYRKAGYATAGFFSGPYLHPCFGFDRGFDRYESCLGFTTLFDAPPSRRDEDASPADLGAEAALMERRAHEAVTSETVTRRALDFVTGHVKAGEEKPFFLFLHYFDVHNDFTPPPSFDRRFGPPYTGWVDGRNVMTDPRYRGGMSPADLERLTALYDGEIGWVDRNLSRLFRSIDRLDPGILERSVIVVTSDHGEEFFEHGRLGHRHNLHESLVRIPLILRCPARIAVGKTIAGAVSLCDVAPTLLDLTGIAVPPIVTGSSLLPAIERGAADPRPALLELTETPRGGMLGGKPSTGDRYRKHLALRMGRYKLISVQEWTWSRENPGNFEGAILEERHVLYDLESDPLERNDLCIERPGLLREALAVRRKRLGVLHERYVKYRTEPRAGGREPISDAVSEALRALGY